jgi:hypothetical protein
MLVSQNNLAGMLHCLPAWAIVLSVMACAGCESFAPGNLASGHKEKRIMKEAENDPFPSPADVGLSQPIDTP